MDWVQDFFDFTEELDFFTKYAIVIANFALIIFLTLMRARKPIVANQPKKRILFVTAHPDDEAMFFVPTISNLHQQYELHLLCLSNGNSEGLGKVREKELEKCAQYLHVDKIEIANDAELPDGMHTHWKEDDVLRHINAYLQKFQIDAIITFDCQGISGHANHIAVYRGIKRLSQSTGNENIKFYQLQSVNIVRKYIGIVDLIFAGFQFSDNFLYVNWNPLRAWRAMTLHASQFVWYRKLFVIFSRYAYINLVEKLK